MTADSNRLDYFRCHYGCRTSQLKLIFSFHTVWALSDSRYRVASPLIRPIGWLSLRRHPTGLM